jgi:replication-associated recombination protein RarA
MDRKIVNLIISLNPYVCSRPSKVDEVSHQLEVVSALRHSVKTGQVPHLLMYGPPGTGKTSTILALAKELFG